MSTAKKQTIDDDGRVFNSKWCSKYLVVPHNKGIVCLTRQYMIAVMNEYNVKRHYKLSTPPSLMTFLVWHE